MALFVFLLILYVSQSAAVTVKVFEGHQSVTLPFFTIPLNNDPSALWTREGSSSEDVHLRDNDVDDLRRQSPHFKGRTDMKPDALETGDLSLVLKNPTASDSGTYLCVVKEGLTVVRRTSVELVVISVKVTAEEGAESVSLPCTMRPLNMNKDPSAQWTREGSDQVHLRVKQGDEEKDDLRLQSTQFQGRTQMNPDALQTGDLSLVLKKNTLKDSGTYTCTVREGSSETGRISVEVNIEPIPLPGPGPLIAGLVVLFLLVGLCVLFGALFYHKKWMSTIVIVNTFETANPVSLPFKLKRGLNMKKNPSVKWIREGPTPEIVYLREKEGNGLLDQSTRFKGRTEMENDSLETGDLTLTLRHLKASDTGNYTCVVREGTKEVGRIAVELIVRRSITHTVTAWEGDKYVPLFCIMRGLDMDSDPSVLWIRDTGSTTETVHLRVKDRDDLSKQSPHFTGRTLMKPDSLQTGDLSLTLNHPTASDSGTYTCVVKQGRTEMSRIHVELKWTEPGGADQGAGIQTKKKLLRTQSYPGLLE